MSVDNSSIKLFQPIKLGDVTLKHRVALSPMTRFRASKAHVPSEIAIQYYTQRAKFPGTLLISEATCISPDAAGQDFVPGIWNQDQIDAWREVCG